MRTTNLFIDFLIVGFIGLITITLPFLLFFKETFRLIIKYDYQNQAAFFFTIATVLIYIIGIVFNQLADILIKKSTWLLRLQDINDTKNEIEEEFNLDNYHYLIQLIVQNSNSSYNYLSYRRTIIRIIRALLISSIAIIIIHLLAALIFSFIFGSKFSAINLSILLCLVLASFLLRYIYIRLYKGYFNATRNFAKIIEENYSKT